MVKVLKKLWLALLQVSLTKVQASVLLAASLLVMNWAAWENGNLERENAALRKEVSALERANFSCGNFPRDPLCPGPECPDRLGEVQNA